MTSDQVQDEMVQNANAFLNLVEKLNSLEGEELQEFLCSWQLVPKEEIEI
jgi:hypothetical protein